VKQSTKIAILEAKEKQLTRRLDMYVNRLKYLEEAEAVWDR
jgi:chromosome segregation ATPase